MFDIALFSFLHPCGLYGRVPYSSLALLSASVNVLSPSDVLLPRLLCEDLLAPLVLGPEKSIVLGGGFCAVALIVAVEATTATG